MLATVSDRHLRVQNPGHTDSTLYFTADVITANDYYAFGAPMPGRKYNIDSSAGTSKDTCVTCGQLKTALYSYRNAMTDSTKLKAHLDSSFAAFHRSAGSWLTSLRTCKLLKEYFYFPDSSGHKRNYFNFGSHSQYSFGKGDATMEAWIWMPDTTSAIYRILMTTRAYTYFSSSSFGAWGISLLMANSKPVLMVEDFNSGVSITSNSRISLSAWHHIVGVRIGNTKTNWKLYIDGTAVATTASSGTQYTGNTDTLGIGPLKVGDDADGYPTGYPFKGYIREARAYKRAITSTEVAASYNSGCGAAPSDTTGLVLWTPINEGTGGTAHDQSRFAQSGTYVSYFGLTNNWHRDRDTSCMVSNGTQILCKTINTTVAQGYRYGFNGKPKDDETYGEGDEYDFGARVLDVRLGRWLGCDPLTAKYSFYSPYVFAGNNPILFIDPDGKALVVAGSEKEYAKFEAAIKKEFGNLVTLKRGIDNTVTLTLNMAEISKLATETNKSEDQIKNELIAKESYKTLNKIADPNPKNGTTNIELGEGDMQLLAFFGNPQPLYMDTQDKLGKIDGYSAFAGLIHELEEGYQYQVIQGSPTFSNNPSDLHDKAYIPAHKKALQAEAKALGVDKVIHDLVSDYEGSTSGFLYIETFKTVKKDNKSITTIVEYKIRYEGGELKMGSKPGFPKDWKGYTRKERTETKDIPKKKH